MKIERINENTLKFYISYMDIEDRGFDREEIWFNKDRSEELFWQIMDEAHHQESFALEGPLWIQVQALEKGMEILVTRAQMMKEGNDAPTKGALTNRRLDVPLKAEKEGEETVGEDEKEDTDAFQNDEPQDLTFIIEFKDIEDVINLSHAIEANEGIDSALYHYQNNYYLKITFSDEMDEDKQDDLLSRMLEFGLDTGMTESLIDEYGHLIIKEHALETIRHQF
ncbi:MAG: adaptor protein MecA [Sporolactobacillus sp.]